jgi:type II secretory pathway component PulC
MTFKRTADGRFAPDELRVLRKGSGGLSTPVSPAGTSQPAHDEILTNDHVKKMDRSQFEKKFSDTDSLLRQMSASPVRDGPSISGVRIADMAEDSALSEIGLGPGDIIANINGHPITSAQQLLESLKSVPKDRGLVMIQRQRGEVHDSVYIHLR